MNSKQITLIAKHWRIIFVWCGAILGILALVWLILQEPMLVLLLAIGIIVIFCSIFLFFGWKGILSFKNLIPTLIVVAVLFPYIRIPGEIPDVRPEFVIIVAAAGLLVLGCLVTSQSIMLRRFPVYKWFALFGLSIVLSMACSLWVYGYPLIGQDFWELAKVFLYFLIFAVVASQFINLRNLKRYYILALCVFIISAVIGFLQYIQFAEINEVVSPYYAPTQMRGLLVHGRIAGTTPNPNEFGALMVLAASFALAGGLIFREKKMRILCWSVLSVYVLALVLTLSRSALVSLFLTSTTILLLFLRQKGLKNKLKRLVIFVLLGCIIGGLTIQVMPEKAFFRFGELSRFTEATSWQGRVANWETHFSIWLESPLLGWGPGKATMGTIVDNEWLLLLRRYGLLGLTVFLCFFSSLFFGLSRIRKMNSTPTVIALTLALQGTLVGYVVYMSVASVYHSLQLMPICLVFLGLAYSQWQGKGNN